MLIALAFSCSKVWLKEPPFQSSEQNKRGERNSNSTCNLLDFFFFIYFTSFKLFFMLIFKHHVLILIRGALHGLFFQYPGKGVNPYPPPPRCSSDVILSWDHSKQFCKCTKEIKGVFEQTLYLFLLLLLLKHIFYFNIYNVFTLFESRDMKVVRETKHLTNDRFGRGRTYSLFWWNYKISVHFEKTFTKYVSIHINSLPKSKILTCIIISLYRLFFVPPLSRKKTRWCS